MQTGVIYIALANLLNEILTLSVIFYFYYLVIDTNIIKSCVIYKQYGIYFLNDDNFVQKHEY